MVVGEFTQEADLVVIGGGPAGYSAAFRAAELGVPTLLVNAHPGGLGGACLHDGCIPSKTLAHAAESIGIAQHAADLGVTYAKPRIDPAAMRARVQQAIEKLGSGLESVRRKLGVEVVTGHAHFDDPRTLAIPDSPVQRVRFKRAIIATGCPPRQHHIVKVNGSTVLFPQDALRLKVIPRSMVVIGSTYIALELAGIFSALGTRVTLLDEGDHWLPECDTDIARPVLKRLGEACEAMRTGTRVTALSGARQGVELSVEHAESPSADAARLRCDIAVVAIGHAPDTAALRLGKAQVACDDAGFIRVNPQLRTSTPRILAAGDVTGLPLLADKALHQGRIAGEVAAGRDVVFDARAVPIAIFTDPQVAWCGLTETQAAASSAPYAVAKAPWGASGRAVGLGRSDGLTKIIYDPNTTTVLGVAMSGVTACELIGQGALAIEMGATLADLASTILPHPSLSELLGDAARQRAGQSTV